jgi:DNA modification methylase
MKRVVIGSAILYRADCRDVLPEISSGSVPMIFTDPPYGHNNNSGDLIHRWEAALGRLPCGETSPLGARPILNDGPEANGLVQWLFGEAARVLWRDSCCCCCCCCGGGGPDPQFARWSMWMDQKLAFDQMVIWDKGKIGMGWKYRRSYETVLVGHRKGGKLRWFDKSKRIENIIRPGDYGIRKIIPQKTDHPTPKPAELAQHFIRLHTKHNDLVLDPFMGGGSTALAALALGRRFIGIEKDPKYFDIACRRIKQALKERKAAA